MATLVPYSDPKLRKPNLLKDFLLDDFSSCSSSGFRSFPRRQCCTTTVRILLDRDLAKKKLKNYQIPPTQKSSSPAKTMLQRASTAVYKAVKNLPFSSAAKPRRAILPRSISRKLFKRSFWKKSDRKEIERWNTFHTVVENKSEPSILYSPVKTNTVITSSKSKKSYGSSVSWTESEFTSSSSCSSGNSGTVNSSENEVVKNSEQVVKMGKRVGVVVGEAITTCDANCVVDSPKVCEIFINNCCNFIIESPCYSCLLFKLEASDRRLLCILLYFRCTFRNLAYRILNCILRYA